MGVCTSNHKKKRNKKDVDSKNIKISQRNNNNDIIITTRMLKSKNLMIDKIDKNELNKYPTNQTDIDINNNKISQKLNGSFKNRSNQTSFQNNDPYEIMDKENIPHSSSCRCHRA